MVAAAGEESWLLLEQDPMRARVTGALAPASVAASSQRSNNETTLIERGAFGNGYITTRLSVCRNMMDNETTPSRHGLTPTRDISVCATNLLYLSLRSCLCWLYWE